jgi:quercetin dioxygenase-like cupin family protein
MMETDQSFRTNIPAQLKQHRRLNTAKVDKRTLKYLATCTDPRAYIAVTRAAPARAIQDICNAAFNVEQGDIHLSPKQKALFRTHRKDIATLTSPRVTLARKRKVIVSQKGGFFFIPALISAAIGALGSTLLGKLFGGQQQQPQQ